MPRRFEIPVKDFDNLQMHLYTIGYPLEGEVIIAIICEGEKVLFTALTDCYENRVRGTDESDCYNHINTILERHDNPSINAFIWTHPDKDHSVGIPSILECYDPNHEALIYLPGAFDKEDKFPICDDAASAFRYLHTNYSYGRKYNVIPIDLDDGEYRSLCKIEFKEITTSRTISCSFNFLAPFGSLIWRRSANGADFVMNGLSIVYTMRFNGVDFLFCGDLANQSIRFLEKNFLQNVHFVKIPHHGSDEPKSFIGKLINNQVEHPVSTTTIYQSKLPVKSVLEEYKKMGHEVYCTGRGDHFFGCIKTTFNIYNLDRDTVLTGNAYML